jgi:hypothetical protein
MLHRPSTTAPRSLPAITDPRPTGMANRRPRVASLRSSRMLATPN